MIDFFCKSMAASNFCDDRKSALKLLERFIISVPVSLHKISSQYTTIEKL